MPTITPATLFGVNRTRVLNIRLMRRMHAVMLLGPLGPK